MLRENVASQGEKAQNGACRADDLPRTSAKAYVSGYAGTWLNSLNAPTGDWPAAGASGAKVHSSVLHYLQGTTELLSLFSTALSVTMHCCKAFDLPSALCCACALQVRWHTFQGSACRKMQLNQPVSDAQTVMAAFMLLQD